MNKAAIKPTKLPPLEAPYGRRESILLAYARDRLAAGLSLVVCHAEKPGECTLELSKVEPSGSPTYYMITKWPFSGTAVVKIHDSELVDPDTVRWLVQMAIRSSVPIPFEPPITPDRKREKEVETKMRETYFHESSKPQET